VARARRHHGLFVAAHLLGELPSEKAGETGPRASEREPTEKPKRLDRARLMARILTGEGLEAEERRQTVFQSLSAKAKAG